MDNSEKFEKFYNKILNKESKFLEGKKKDAKKEKIKNDFLRLFLIVFGIILYFFCSYFFKHNNWDDMFVTLIGLIYFLGAVLAFYILYKNEKQDDYRIYFKDKVIREMLLLIDDCLTYHPKGFIDSMIYDDADFEKYDKYYSDDFVSGKLKNGFNFILSDVKTTIESRNRSGHSENIEQFSGLFASMECPKNFKESIYIRINKNLLAKVINYKLPYKKLKLDLDSSSFEKEFDVYSSDKIVALQLLTSDIMQFLVEFKKEMNINYEITIKNNHIYYRFLCGELFETNDLNKYSLNKEMLYKYYKIIKFSLFLSGKLKEMVGNIEY